MGHLSQNGTIGVEPWPYYQKHAALRHTRNRLERLGPPDTPTRLAAPDRCAGASAAAAAASAPAAAPAAALAAAPGSKDLAMSYGHSSKEMVPIRVWF